MYGIERGIAVGESVVHIHTAGHGKALRDQLPLIFGGKHHQCCHRTVIRP